MRLIDEEITLKLDGHTVRLRPSLRCALKVSQIHGEPAEIASKVLRGHVECATDILRHGIDDDDERAVALSWFAFAPVPLRKRIELISLDCYTFALLLAGIDPEEKPQGTAQSAGPALPFNRSLGELFGAATGLLHWPPDAAWKATPREISHALAIWRRTLPGYEPTDKEKAEHAFANTFDKTSFNVLKNM